MPKCSDSFAPRPAPGHPGGGVDDDAGRLDQAGPEQRGEGQPGRGRIATGGGDQGRPVEAGPEQLGQAERGLGQQLRRRMLLAVPGGIERRIVQPEIGRQIHDDPDPLPQGWHHPLRLPVRQGAEHDVETVEAVRPSCLESLRAGRLVDQARVGGGQRRRVLTDHLAGVGMRRDHGHVDVRMAGQKPEQLDPGVPGSSDDTRLHRISIHTIAYSWD